MIQDYCICEHPLVRTGGNETDEYCGLCGLDIEIIIGE